MGLCEGAFRDLGKSPVMLRLSFCFVCGMVRVTYEESSEWSTQDKLDVQVEILLILLSRLIDERSECRDLILREARNEMMHILCHHHLNQLCRDVNEGERTNR